MSKGLITARADGVGGGKLSRAKKVMPKIIRSTILSATIKQSRGRCEPSNLQPAVPISRPPRQSSLHPCLALTADAAASETLCTGVVWGLGMVGRRAVRVKEAGSCVSLGRANGLERDGEGRGKERGRTVVISSLGAAWAMGVFVVDLRMDGGHGAEDRESVVL